MPDLLGADFGCSRPDAGAQPKGGDARREAAGAAASSTSDRRRAFAGDVAAHTRSLVALLDKLGLATVDLLGHSFGGFLVQVNEATHEHTPEERLVGSFCGLVLEGRMAFKVGILYTFAVYFSCMCFYFYTFGVFVCVRRSWRPRCLPGACGDSSCSAPGAATGEARPQTFSFVWMIRSFFAAFFF